MKAAAKQLLLNRAIIVSVLVGLFLSVGVVWKVGLGEIVQTFQDASGQAVAAYIFVSILIAIGLTIKWGVVLASYGVRLPFYTLFIYRLIGYAVGYVTPASHLGGEPVRALLLRKQGIPFNIGLSSAIVDRSIDLMFNIAFFFIGSLIILNTASFPMAARISIFLLSLIMVSIATLATYNILRKKEFLVPLCERLRLHKLKRWRQIKRSASEVELLISHFFTHKVQFRRALIINTLLWGLMFLEYKFALLILGYDANIFSIFLFLTGVGIAYSIPIPAALGVLELGQISAGALLGVRASIGVGLAYIIRVRDIAWTIIGLIMLSFFHMNIFRLLEKSQEIAKKHSSLVKAK